MNDRELLEFAAKAAGIAVYESSDGTVQNRTILAFEAGGRMGTMPYEEQWNPFADDAQALRLAVKLNIDVMFRFIGGSRCETLAPGCLLVSEGFFIANSGDKFAASRRAIVRAAAEIGRLCHDQNIQN